VNTSRHILVLAVLAAIWCLLSGHYTGLLLGLGGLSCIAAYLVYQRIYKATSPAVLIFHPIRQLMYLLWLIIQIIRSNIDVIRTIFDRSRLAPEFFDVKTDDLDEAGQVMFANSITLTPGTVSIGISDGYIQVHGLTLASKEALADEGMKSRVEHLVGVDSPGTK
jgi:multicomponent Na+:H+ antiporter subunit E